MKVFLILAILPLVLSENILRLDLSPEEAQKYLASAPSGLGYARKLGEHDLPAGKSAYYQGRLIEHPEEFIERLYVANQFHGQDGLGKAKFGFKDWNQARVEDIDVHGKTQGAYQYVDPNGENIVVNYWADQQGFHQTDNRPTPKLEPVTDTPAVKAAREAHEKAWKEAAEANKAYGAKYGGGGGDDDNSGAYTEQEPGKYVHDSPTGPPRGFFYQFDYETPLVIKKEELGRFLEPKEGQ